MDISGKRKDAISYRTISLQNRSAELRTVVIPNLPINLTEDRLEDYFRKWGGVEGVMCDREDQDIAIVVFKNNDSVGKVSGKHKLHGNKIFVEPMDYDLQSNKDDYFRAQHLLQDVKHGQLSMILLRCTTVEEQMEVLQQELCLSKESLCYRLWLRNHFHSLFVKYFPDSELQIFGSSVGGYGFEGADIDLFLRLPEDYFAPGSRVVDFVPDLQEVAKGRVDLKRLSTEARLKILMMAIKTYMPNCKDIQFHPSKICPIVKFQYIDNTYSISCDLSAFIQTAVVCSKLMHLYHELDPRVRPLMVSLRYWSQSQKIIDPEKKLKTFTFTLLVIFFLQNRNPPILPTLSKLRRLTKSSHFIGKWDCAFCDDIKLIPKSSNTQTLAELLKEFFFFYANFDFSKNVISSRTGKALSRTQFLSDPSNEAFKLRDLSIQHSFELNRNTTFKFARGFPRELSSKFMAAAGICHNFSVTDCAVNSNWGLGKLLEEVVIYSKQDSLSLSRLLWCNVPMTALLPGRGLLVDAWFNKVCQTIQNILSIALQSELEIVYNGLCQPSIQEMPFRVMGNSSSEGGFRLRHDENALLLLKCKVWDKIWIRRAYWKHNFSELSLGLEGEVSRCVIGENNLKTFVKFDCVVKKQRTEQPSVTIEMKPYTRGTLHKTISILSLVYRILRSFMRDFPN